MWWPPASFLFFFFHSQLSSNCSLSLPPSLSLSLSILSFRCCEPSFTENSKRENAVILSSIIPSCHVKYTIRQEQQKRRQSNPVCCPLRSLICPSVARLTICTAQSPTPLSM